MYLCMYDIGALLVLHKRARNAEVGLGDANIRLSIPQVLFNKLQREREYLLCLHQASALANFQDA